MVGRAVAFSTIVVMFIPNVRRFCTKCGKVLRHVKLDETCEECGEEAGQPPILCRDCLATLDQETDDNYERRCLKCHQAYSERLIDQLHADVLDHVDMLDTLDQAQRLWRDERTAPRSGSG